MLLTIYWLDATVPCMVTVAAVTNQTPIIFCSVTFEIANPLRSHVGMHLDSPC